MSFNKKSDQLCQNVIGQRRSALKTDHSRFSKAEVTDDPQAQFGWRDKSKNLNEMASREREGNWRP